VRIIKYPHPTLRHKSKPLRRVDRELVSIVRQMFELMHEHKGVGLAANQVDLPYRLFILQLDDESEQKSEDLVFINPVITQRKGMVEKEEGCLSFPEIYAPVRRPERITITAYNLAGEEVTYDVGGLFARAAQHEYDHLEGVLFIDRVSEANRLKIKESLGDLVREFEGDRQRGLIPGDEHVAARLAELEQLRT
jgi:peptide deformylase